MQMEQRRCSSEVEYLPSMLKPLGASPALQKQNKCWSQWLMPAILATQEAEIRRIEVQSQSGQIVLREPIWKKKPSTKKGWWGGSRCRP
jgi:hypothetical protein